MIYTVLTTSWTDDMIKHMSKYLEVHGRDGIVLYYCFLQHFEGTTTEDIIEATLLLVPDKMQLDLFDGNVTNYTTSIRRPVRKLQKSNHEISLHIYIHTFHGCSNCSNDEFKAYIYRVYAEWRSGGPAKSWSILELLDNLDREYNRIRALGRWESDKNAEILALTAQLAIQSTQLANLTTSMALLSATPTAFQAPVTVISPSPRKSFEKPLTPPAPGAPEIQKYKGKTWKWCGQCVQSSRGGNWILTHITSEHRARDPTPQVSPATANANLATTDDINLADQDFI